MAKLVIIGPMNVDGIPSSGDSVKNQFFLERFALFFDKVIPVDTAKWRNRPWVLFRLVLVLLLHKQAKVLLSVNPDSADKLIRIINRFRLPNDVFYWVVGGSFHIMIQEGKFSSTSYSSLKRIVVQGESMVLSLTESGLNNVVYLPNSKLIKHYGKRQNKDDGVTHFVFLSRIEEYKGCNVIFDSIDILNRKGYQGRFDVVFYGCMTNDNAYADSFRDSIVRHKETKYCGLLDLRDQKNYDVLALFDAMLFPTFWQGEGFPGVVIDAYISSLPIIATDWNLNRDVIEDGKTGWIIPPHDPEALAERMKYVIDNPQIVCEMSKECHTRAAQYDSRVVLSEENLHKIGLI